MAAWKSNRMMFLAIPIMVLALACIFIGHVHAQDLVPNDPAPVVDPDVPVDVPPDTAPVEPVVDVPLLDPAPVDAPPVDLSTVETTLEPAEQVPAEPVILAPVVDEPVVEITGLSEGDPYYDYLGIHYPFGTIGAALTDAITRVTSGSVTIYVEGNATYPEIVTVDGGAGGSKIAGLTGTVVSGNYPTISRWVTVQNMTTPFSLNGFKIIPAAATGNALILANNSSAIALTDVTVENNSVGGNGIFVNNESGPLSLLRVHTDSNTNMGAAMVTTNTVNIAGSSFDDNGNTGLSINSTKAITLTTVSASGNVGGSSAGALIGSETSLTIKNGSFIKNGSAGLATNAPSKGAISLDTVYANNNGNSGLLLVNNGSVTLKNVWANDNADAGAYIETCFSNPCTYTGAVTVSDSTFLSNDGVLNDAGLFISSNGSISLANVDASSNGSVTYQIGGAWIVNYVVPSISTVKVSGSTFNSNYNTGLTILSKGNVTLNNVTASSNKGRGARIDNTYGTGSVTLTNGYFELNSLTGLYIASFNNISLTDVIASSNSNGGSGYYGAYIESFAAPGFPTVTVVRGQYNKNKNTGLSIYAKGLITLNSVQANENIGGSSAHGVLLDNTTGTGGIILLNSTGSSQMNSNEGSGLDLSTNGTVTITGVSALGNHVRGANIDNSTGNANVTITGGNFENNYAEGLYVHSKGSITFNGPAIGISKADTNGTAGSNFGVNLDNSAASTPKPVTVTKLEVNANTSTGLHIHTLGNVTLDGISAENNTGVGSDGVEIIGNAVPASNVTVNTSKGPNYFSNNGGKGLHLDNWSGSLTLNNVHADGNAEQGVYFNTGSIIAVTINNSYFSANGYEGIRIYTSGVITLNGGYANSNGTAGSYSGARLENQNSISPNKVNVSKFEFSENTYIGLEVHSQGAITLNNVTAHDNQGSYGIWLSNNLDFSSPVSILNTLGPNVMKFNHTNQLGIWSYGLVTVNGVVIDGTGSSGYGIEIHNITPDMPTTLLPANVILSNDTVMYSLYNGILIGTKGNVSFTNVKSEFSGDITHPYSGAKIAVTATSTLKTVTISSGDFSHNIGGGLDVDTTGNISLTNVNASFNGNATYLRNGVNLSNTAGTGSITLTNVTADHNSDRGLHILSAGAITLKTGSANANALSINDYGAYLDNTYSAGTTNPPAISVSRFTFNGNTSDGFEIYSKGMVTLNNVTANDNTGGNYGGFVSNTSSFARGVSVLNTLGNNLFKGNPYTELYISSFGPVIVNGTTADGDNKANIGYGIFIANTGGPGPVDVTLSKVTAIGNLAMGIYVTTAGNISLSQVDASHNGNHGAYFLGPTIGVNKTATASTSTFSENANCGLWLVTTGNITLTNITASLNGNPSLCGGIYVENNAGTGNITLTNNIAINAISSNWGNGLDARSRGTITISGVYAYHNHYSGMYLANDSSSSGGGVTITNVNVTDSRSDGLQVYSNGAISLTSGVFDQNGFDSGFGRGAILDNSTGTNKTVSVSKSSFSNNYGNGLEVRGSGNITLNAVTSKDNNAVGGSDGVFLNNSLTAGSTVSVLNTLGSNVFSNNYHNGIEVYGGGGAVTLKGVTANENKDASGILISGSGVLSITTATMLSNAGYGLSAAGLGSFTLTSVNASGNAAGANLNNTAGSGTITINKSTFNSSSSSDGLDASSTGDITLNNVTASFNNSAGANLNNSSGSGKVFILSTLGVNTFNNNSGLANLYIDSNGDVSGDKITANLGTFGAGIEVYSSAKLTLTNIVTNSNNRQGIYVGVATGEVSISNAIVFNNGVTVVNQDGIYIANGHNVTIANSTILGNGTYGIRAYITPNTLTVSHCLVVGNDRYAPTILPDIYTNGTLVIIP